MQPNQPYYDPKAANPQNTFLQHPQQPVVWSNQPQAQPSGQGCPQILYACPSPTTNVYEKYKGTQSIWNGSIQIVIGVLCIAFNAASIGVMDIYYYSLATVVGYGIWGGVFFIIAGSLGIAAGKSKTKCLKILVPWFYLVGISLIGLMIIAFMVLCIISCAVTIVIFSLSILNLIFTIQQSSRKYIGVVMDLFLCSTCRPCSHAPKSEPYAYDYPTQTALNGVLLALSIIEAAFGIWGSVNCCASACCGAPKTYLSPTPNLYNQGNTRVIVVDNLQALNPNILQQGYPVASTYYTSGN